MELQFQQQQQAVSVAKPSKCKGRNKSNSSGTGNKFVGVRQRPSGRWVAEIKDTTQKIRMWLGTFETAEEAARAYDEAACLLRGSNTRTNFITQVSSNSPLASRIRNLLNQKKPIKKGTQPPPMTASYHSSSSTSVSTGTIETSSASSARLSHDQKQEAQMADDVYRPYFSNGREEFESGSSPSDLSWVFDSGFDRLPLFDGFELPKQAFFPDHNANSEISEFDRMKVERQISASLYAMNGVHEYLETVHDASDPLWDLPPLCQLFCRT